MTSHDALARAAAIWTLPRLESMRAIADLLEATAAAEQRFTALEGALRHIAITAEPPPGDRSPVRLIIHGLANAALKGIEPPVVGNCPECDEPLGDGLPGCVHWPTPPSASPRQGEPVGLTPAFEMCPVCGYGVMMRLVADWQDGRALPVVGCGNPWHYATSSLGDSPVAVLSEPAEAGEPAP